jgi:3'(2'), 5'-bisphosphate nucleotidase
MIEALIKTAIMAAFDAGKAIMKVYSDDFSVEYKEDQSPLTLADKQAHLIISGYLNDSGLPILSEEGAEIPYSERKDWKTFWLVDPLDGTKEFVNRNGDFTVNIALLTDNKPIAGVIYAPVPNLCYYALPGYGAFKIDGNLIPGFTDSTLADIIASSIRLPEKRNTDDYIIVASRSHQNKETADFIETYKESGKNVTFLSKGSSLKF